MNLYSWVGKVRGDTEQELPRSQEDSLGQPSDYDTLSLFGRQEEGLLRLGPIFQVGTGYRKHNQKTILRHQR
jgi:hypothetical protein